MPQLLRQQFIPAPLDVVWDFFATPRNLDEMTPPAVKFQILGAVAPSMYAGQLIDYRISPMPGIWCRWRTEIRHVRERAYFVDEQRLGPYKFWYHEHCFDPVPGGVQMTDRVTYEIGWGPAGWLADRLWVRGQLERIFDYRRQCVETRFGPARVER
jgi:ligand-binding SRPBCC domain-containing protein